MVLAFGSQGPSQAMADAITAAVEKGVTVVAAAGNNGNYQCLYPAKYDNVIAVACTNDIDELSSFSNFHEALTLCAPGETTMQGEQAVLASSVVGPLPGNLWAAASGTSMSTGFAAGAAVLVRAQYINWPDKNVPVLEISNTLKSLISASSTMIQMPPGPSVSDKPRLSVRAATLSGPTVPAFADINGDGAVDGADLAKLLGTWYAPLPNDRLHLTDLQRDEVVAGGDLAALLGAWNTGG
jgi:subtilisin family serine protease